MSTRWLQRVRRVAPSPQSGAHVEENVSRESKDLRKGEVAIAPETTIITKIKNLTRRLPGVRDALYGQKPWQVCIRLTMRSDGFTALRGVLLAALTRFLFCCIDP